MSIDFFCYNIMKKYFFILFLIIPLSANALWKGFPRPQADFLRYNPDNSNHFYVIANISDDFNDDEAKCVAYESKDGGQTFQEIILSSIPSNHSATNYCNTIKYA